MTTESSEKNALSRRDFLAGVGAGVGVGLVPAALHSPALAQSAPVDRSLASLKGAKGTKLVLLGTFGGPGPGRAMHSTSHVILSDGAAYIVDCGLGVTNQFARTGIPFESVRSIFITHHHADHNGEYGPFLLVGWIRGLSEKVRAFGPPPLKEMTEGFLNAYRTTFDIWAKDYKMQPLRRIEVTEISRAGPVMRDDRVSVRSAVVEHPPVVPALAYRFDFKDRSIVFSGDTAPVAAVKELAKGADVLVHEAMFTPAVEKNMHAQIAAGRPLDPTAYMAHMLDSHSDVVEVGKIARDAGVKTLVVSHLTPNNFVTDDMWREAAGQYFKGEIILGKDLMVI
jgi:ribonuclease BN (tRNA processing enzyme)